MSAIASDNGKETDHHAVEPAMGIDRWLGGVEGARETSDDRPCDRPIAVEQRIEDGDLDPRHVAAAYRLPDHTVSSSSHRSPSDRR